MVKDKIMKNKREIKKDMMTHEKQIAKLKRLHYKI